MENPQPRRNWGKRATLGALGLATIVGTFSAHYKDFPPIFIRHTGTSYGISLGLVQKFEEGSVHNGVVLGFWNYGSGTINGAEIGAVNDHDASVYEDERFVNKHIDGRINGLQLGVGNKSREGNRLQLGVINVSERDKRYFDVGIINLIKSEENKGYISASLLFNWNFKDREAVENK